MGKYFEIIWETQYSNMRNYYILIWVNTKTSCYTQLKPVALSYVTFD